MLESSFDPIEFIGAVSGQELRNAFKSRWQQVDLPDFFKKCINYDLCNEFVYNILKSMVFDVRVN